MSDKEQGEGPTVSVHEVTGERAGEVLNALEQMANDAFKRRQRKTEILCQHAIPVQYVDEFFRLEDALQEERKLSHKSGVLARIRQLQFIQYLLMLDGAGAEESDIVFQAESITVTYVNGDLRRPVVRLTGEVLDDDPDKDPDEKDPNTENEQEEPPANPVETLSDKDLESAA